MRVLIFDTETTGFFKGESVPLYHQPEVFQLAALMVDSDTLEQDREAPEGGFIDLGFRTRKSIPREIEELVGVQDSDYNGKPKFKDEYFKIRRMFGAANLLVAHNLVFDIKMINLELMRMNAVSMFPWPSSGICTMQDARHRWPKQPNKLIDLHYRVCGTSMQQRHTAATDVNMLHEILRAKPEILRENLNMN